VYNASEPKCLEFRSWPTTYTQLSQYDKNCMNSVFTIEQNCRILLKCVVKIFYKFVRLDL